MCMLQRNSYTCTKQTIYQQLFIIQENMKENKCYKTAYMYMYC